MKKVFIINGPNLNLLGTREPAIYGSETIGSISTRVKELADELGMESEFLQSNIEGELIDLIQQAGREADGIIINPAGYSHTSVAILDALKATRIPKVEVHLSNIFARDEFRRRSVTAPGCDGSISGLGSEGYLLALRYLAGKIKDD